MPRNMSFSLTEAAMREQRKTVTRRTGWRFLKVGQIVNACRKCMGLKKGERIEVIGQIEIISVRREPLNAILDEDYGASREGFEFMTNADFVAFFLESMGGKPDQEVTRIEFRHI